MCQKHCVKCCQREGEVEREGKNDLKAVKVVENRKKIDNFLKGVSLILDIGVSFCYQF